MIIEHSNEIEIRIPTNDPQLVQDIIHALVWHQINDLIHEGKNFESMKTECEIIKAFSPDDEILTRAKNNQMKVVDE